MVRRARRCEFVDGCREKVCRIDSRLPLPRTGGSARDALDSRAIRSSLVSPLTPESGSTGGCAEVAGSAGLASCSPSESENVGGRKCVRSFGLPLVSRWPKIAWVGMLLCEEAKFAGAGDEVW